MSILDKIKKASTIKESSVLSKSKFFTQKDMVQTDIPMINVALSGSLDGGFTPGLTMFAGPSKHFKTAFSLLMAKAYLDKYPDSAVLFYDSEFGTPQSYFHAFGIDIDRVLHTPIMDVEQLKFDIMQQLTSVDRDDKLIIIIDSIGNLASKKEVEDAMDGKSVADMSRAKQIKSLFRMVTPYLTMKDIPMVVVNHTYKEIGLYPKDIVGGGCVVEGTLIQTPEGLKPVQNFVVGDIVRTLEGDREVTSVWNPETLDVGEPECFEVEFEDGFKVVCSDKHKFLIGDVWVEAKDLNVGMESVVY
jgi:RecA/RadA recombinase